MPNSLPIRRAVLIGLISASATVHAQERADSDAISEVIVTGTRVADRSRLDTLSPVDVLPERALETQGSTELATALARVAPSLNFPRPSVTDGTDSLRPATLRGLSPDQALVLVDSKRRHATALVNLNGSVGRGSAAVDLNALPLAAIDRIEVLRDGASAQYGSDAIAGVLNIHLREAREGANVTASFGSYDTTVDTARGSRDEHDGQTTSVAGWIGLGLGSAGFLTLSAEYRDRDPTSRGDLDPRVPPLPAPAVTSRFGDPESRDVTFYANAGLPLASGWDLYGWAGFQDRDASAAATPRLSNNANNVVAIFPNGFLPLITSDIQDITAAGGTRGTLAEWDVDFSLVYGRNRLRYGVENSVNATYGASSPTSFDAGALIYDQFVLNAGFSRGFDWGLAAPVNVAWGAEVRREGYEIQAGEPASYDRGTGNPGASPGAQGFPGLQPSNVVDEDRTAYSLYADVETNLTEKLLASVAARAEDYSDFGSTATGKVSARYDFTPLFALRGTVSSGFRAPSLQQQFFTSTATVFQQGIPAPFETGTFPATAPVAVSLGARDLEPEKSWNYSLGAVVRVGGFEATVDTYQIDIRNRIVLSENLSEASTPGVGALLAPYNVTAARFFINGVGTRTRGVDAVLRKVLESDTAGRFDLTAALNFNDTDVTRVPTSTAVLPNVVLFNRQNELRFERGTPKDKWVLGTDWSRRFASFGLGANLRATRYGETLSAGSAPAQDLVLDPAWVVDLELHADIGPTTLTLGADNLLDEYPTEVPAALNTTGVGAFSSFSPFGFNGRFVYARAAIKW